VASRVGDVPKIVEAQECGYTSVPEDPTDMAEKALLIIDDIELWTRMGHNSRKLAEGAFSSASIAGSLARAYREVLART